MRGGGRRRRCRSLRLGRFWRRWDTPPRYSTSLLARRSGEHAQRREQRLVLRRPRVVHGVDLRRARRRRRCPCRTASCSARSSARAPRRCASGSIDCDDRLPERALADDDRAVVVAQRSGDDLGRARAVTVDERRRAARASRAAERAEHLARLVRSRRARRRRRGRGRATTRRPPGRAGRRGSGGGRARSPCAPSRCERLQLAREHDRRAEPERDRRSDAPALAGIREQPRMHGRRVHELAANRADASGLRPAACSVSRTIVPRGPRMRARPATCSASPRASSSMRTIVSPTCTPARSAGPGRSETTTRPCGDGSTLMPMPGIRRRGLLPHELVVGRREVRGVRIAERRDDLVDRAELQHLLRHRPVVVRARAPRAPGRRGSGSRRASSRDSTRTADSRRRRARRGRGRQRGEAGSAAWDRASIVPARPNG